MTWVANDSLAMTKRNLIRLVRDVTRHHMMPPLAQVRNNPRPDGTKPPCNQDPFAH